VTASFYSTLAQVLPVLLLAFIWDSGFLMRLRQQRRPQRTVDSEGVWFWTKPRVRVYTLLVVGTVTVSIGISVLVLAGEIPDSHGLRVVLSAGLVLVLATLTTRITIDVLWATTPSRKQRPDPVPGKADEDSPENQQN
jgi:hypothetical protein